MPSVSVELISRGERTLRSALESVNGQIFQDFEIVCVDSSGQEDVKDLANEFGVTFINAPKKTKIMEARFLAHDNSKGDYDLVFDSTRILRKDALKILVGNISDKKMAIIREGSVGKGFWVKQAKLRRNIDQHPHNVQNSLNTVASYLLPRFFEAKLLSSVFRNLRERMPSQVFRNIVFGEHHLIFEEAKSLTDSITYVDRELIFHFEDKDLSSILRKYYRYGREQHQINLVSDYKIARSMRSHRRIISKESIGLELAALPLSCARGFAFLSGYLIRLP